MLRPAMTLRSGSSLAGARGRYGTSSGRGRSPTPGSDAVTGEGDAMSSGWG